MRKLGKYFIEIAILLIILGLKDDIFNFVIKKYVESKEVSLEYRNNYYLSYNYLTVKDVDRFDIKNRNDLTNLYYSILNRGFDSFDFYCPETYENCINDIIDITNNQNFLSNVNGYVHPFNSFDTIETTYDSINRINLKIIKAYTDVEIKQINEKVEQIIAEQVKDETDPRKIIEIIHDYVVNNTKYDKDRADNNIIRYNSNTAYGVLFEGYGICSGYADTMAIFLDYYKIPNFKVSSENHVWNAVYLDGEWYHLDLTWDDPITNTGVEMLSHDYFLIDTDKILELDKTEHTINRDFYKELIK
jgi:hypothetical protein